MVRRLSVSLQDEWSANFIFKNLTVTKLPRARKQSSIDYEFDHLVACASDRLIIHWGLSEEVDKGQFLEDDADQE